MFWGPFSPLRSLDMAIFQGQVWGFWGGLLWNFLWLTWFVKKTKVNHGISEASCLAQLVGFNPANSSLSTASFWYLWDVGTGWIFWYVYYVYSRLGIADTRPKNMSYRPQPISNRYWDSSRFVIPQRLKRQVSKEQTADVQWEPSPDCLM